MKFEHYYRLVTLSELSRFTIVRHLKFLSVELYELINEHMHPLYHAYCPHYRCCCGHQDIRTRPSITTLQWDTLFEKNPDECHSYNGKHPCEFQVRSTLDPDDLDLSILHLVYKKILTLKDPADMKSISAIVNLRNMLAHSSTLSIDDVKFEEEWQKARFATLHLAQKLPFSLYSKIDHDIEGLKTKSLDRGECERLLTAMKHIRDTDAILQDISDRLQRMEKQQDEISSDVHDIKRKVGEL